MDYEVFKEIVKEKLPDFLSGKFRGQELEISQIHKRNRLLDRVCLVRNEMDSDMMYPSIHINSMYEQYQECQDMSIVLSNAAHILQNITQKTLGINAMFKNAEEKVVMELMNTEQNKELLRGLPHREMEDLSIVYRIVVEKGEEGIYGVQVTNEIAAQIGMNEEELYQVSKKNTETMLPAVVDTLENIIKECFASFDMPEEMLESLMDESEIKLDMYVISNSTHTNGAACMLYENELHKLAEKVGTDLFILPSSIHEVIAVPAIENPEELAQLVNEVNQNEVSLEERLSNQVYRYDKEARTLSLASDNPNKRLDDIVAEPVFYEKNQSR